MAPRHGGLSRDKRLVRKNTTPCYWHKVRLTCLTVKWWRVLQLKKNCLHKKIMFWKTFCKKHYNAVKSEQKTVWDCLFHCYSELNFEMQLIDELIKIIYCVTRISRLISKNNTRVLSGFPQTSGNSKSLFCPALSWGSALVSPLGGGKIQTKHQTSKFNPEVMRRDTETAFFTRGSSEWKVSENEWG